MMMMLEVIDTESRTGTNTTQDARCTTARDESNRLCAVSHQSRIRPRERGNVYPDSDGVDSRIRHCITNAPESGAS